MITLNLIPEQTKKELKLVDIYIMIKNIIYLILTGIIFIAIILLATKFVLQNHFNQTMSQNYLTAGLHSFTSSEIKKFKQELIVVKEIQDNFVPWSHLIINLEKISNEGVTITSLDIAREDLIVTIKGVADQRDDLINFEKNLNNSGYFKDFEIPLDILFKKEDINFNLELQLVNLDITNILP